MSETEPIDSPTRQGIQSVELAMRILQALEAGGGPMTLSEIAEHSGFQPNKAHRYLVSLVRSGLASQSQGTGRYDFGPTLRRLGAESLRRTNEVAVASEYATLLRDACGHSVNISVWSENGPVLVRWEYGVHVLPINVRVGATLPLLASSSGLVYLANLAPSMTQRVLDAERKRRADDTWPQQRIDEIRDRVLATGLAVTSGGVIPGVSSIAAPVFSSGEFMPLALSVVFPTEVVDQADMDQVSTQLLETSHAISRELGVATPEAS